jgi:PEGA domain
VLLLPARQARGEADLIAHLRMIPGGVMTLKMPPVESADPADLARQIRELLTGTPAAAPSDLTSFEGDAAIDEEPTASPHLLAAASAAINWIRTRRGQWADAAPVDFAPEPSALSAGAPAAHRDPHEPREHYEPYEPIEPYEPYEPIEPTEPYEPYAAEESHETRAPRASYAPLIKEWLPRVAALVAVLAIAGALVSYWPQIRGGVSGTVSQLNAPREASPVVDDPPKPAVPQPAAQPEVDPLSKVSGWVAVFAPFDVSISEGGRGVQVDDRGRAMLAPGRHRLRFQNRELGYDETRVVNVKPADTITINLIPETTIAVTSNEPAEVLIDGTRVGDTPYDGKIGLGTHTVTVKTAGAERQLTVAATSKPVQLEVDLSKP